MVELVSELIIERNITHLVYIWSGSCLVLFLIILWRMGLFKRALMAVGVSFVVNIGWEVSLWINGSRAYDSSLPLAFEFIYHGFTELAPFVLFWLICLKLFGFIGRDEKGTEGKRGKPKNQDASTHGEEERVGHIGDASGADPAELAEDEEETISMNGDDGPGGEAQ